MPDQMLIVEQSVKNMGKYSDEPYYLMWIGLIYFVT